MQLSKSLEFGGCDLELILALGVGIVHAADHGWLAHTGYRGAINRQRPKQRHVGAAGRRVLNCEASDTARHVQQQRAIERLKKAEQRRIPDWFDYRAVSGLSREMQEKLGKIVSQTLGQASRIPGVTPAAVSLINVYIEIQARRGEPGPAL